MTAPLLFNMFKTKTKYPLHSAIRLRREDVVFLYLIEFNQQVLINQFLRCILLLHCKVLGGYSTTYLWAFRTTDDGADQNFLLGFLVQIVSNCSGGGAVVVGFKASKSVNSFSGISEHFWLHFLKDFFRF